MASLIWIFTISHTTKSRSQAYKLLKPHTYHSCRIDYFTTRVIIDWNNLTSDIFFKICYTVQTSDKVNACCVCVWTRSLIVHCVWTRLSSCSHMHAHLCLYVLIHAVTTYYLQELTYMDCRLPGKVVPLPKSDRRLKLVTMTQNT